MKNKLWLVLLMLLVLTDNTFCNKFDTPLLFEKPASEISNDKNSNAENTLPTFIILRVFSITCVSARVEIQMTDPGNAGIEITAHGACWSTNPNPTVNDNKINGSYQCVDLYGLNSGTTYYVRTYVMSRTDTAYSDQVAFTTNSSIEPAISAAIFPPSLSCTGVIIAFNITDDGGNPVINKGICWATEPNPTIEDYLGYYNRYDMTIGNVIYRSNCWLQILQPATQYHARPYFTTSAGTFYGEDLSFITNSEPTIITAGVTDITSTTAKVTGDITSTGGSFVVERGICFDTVPNLDTVIMRGGFGLANHFIEQEVQSVDGAGEFTVSMTNLTPGTRYYVSTFVGVMTGLDYGDQIIAYGDEITFITKNELSVTPATCNLDSDTGSITFDISSNTNWTVSDDADWLTVSPISGVDNRTITVNYNANTMKTPRIATITVSGEGAILDNVSVTQSGSPFILSVLPDDIDVSGEAGDTSFYITSDTKYFISVNADWLTISPDSSSGNDTITIHYEANLSSIFVRKTTIIILGAGVMPQIVTVTQDGYVSVPSLYDSKVTVYPNPVKNNAFFIIDNYNNRKVYLEICDFSGRLIGGKTSTAEKIEFDFSNCSSGIYFYRLRDSEGIIGAGKIIKE